MQSLQMLRFHTNESVSRFLPVNQHNYAIQCHSLWFMLENTPDRRQIKNKNDTEKPNNTKHSKTKLPRFSRLLWYLARKQRGLFYNAPRLTWHTIIQTKWHSEKQTLRVVALTWFIWSPCDTGRSTARRRSTSLHQLWPQQATSTATDSKNTQTQNSNTGWHLLL